MRLLGCFVCLGEVGGQSLALPNTTSVLPTKCKTEHKTVRDSEEKDHMAISSSGVLKLALAESTPSPAPRVLCAVTTRHREVCKWQNLKKKKLIKFSTSCRRPRTNLTSQEAAAHV